MKRREFIAFVAAMAAPWPRTATAQSSDLPMIGFLHPASPARGAMQAAAFRQGLEEAGYIEGRNVLIEYRWAENRYDRLPALAAELARRNVAVIAATGGSTSSLAAKAATSTIPIVFNGGADPVKLGLVTSFSRPGGNMTGVLQLDSMLASKQLGLLLSLVPDAAVIAVLINPDNSTVGALTEELRKIPRTAGQRLLFLEARVESEFDAVFATITQQKAGGLLVATDPFFFGQRDQIVAAAARHRIPAVYAFRDYAEAGGLISYGASLAENYRLVGVYTGRILKGAKPSELPVMQSAKFELVINLKTAKELNFAVPPALLATADEVIE